MYRCLALPAIFSLLGSGLLAQLPFDMLDKTPNFSPTVTFSDHYSEKVVTEDGSRSVEAKPESIALKVVANLVGANAGTPGPATKVGVSAGYFDHEATLAEAPDYVVGKRVATFPLFKDIDLANGNTRTARVGQIVYSWTDEKLTVKVACSDIEGAGVTDIAASDYLVLDSDTTEVINDFTDVSVTFGNASGSRFAYIDGIAKDDLKSFGSPNSDNFEELDVIDVNVKGSIDVDGPEVTTTYPPVAPTVFTATGTATDRTDISLDQVTVNGVNIGTANATIEDNDGDGVWKWQVTGLVLKKGTNRIVLKFSDEDLNVTISTKTVRVL